MYLGGSKKQGGRIYQLAEEKIMSVEMMNDMADYYSRKVEEAEEAERQITEMIDSISDSEERMVLFLHYIEGKTFLEISDDIHLSERTVWYRHSCAIGRLCDSA